MERQGTRITYRLDTAEGRKKANDKIATLDPSTIVSIERGWERDVLGELREIVTIQLNYFEVAKFLVDWGK